MWEMSVTNTTRTPVASGIWSLMPQKCDLACLFDRQAQSPVSYSLKHAR